MTSSEDAVFNLLKKGANFGKRSSSHEIFKAAKKVCPGPSVFHEAAKGRLDFFKEEKFDSANISKKKTNPKKSKKEQKRFLSSSFKNNDQVREWRNKHKIKIYGEKVPNPIRNLSDLFECFNLPVDLERKLELLGVQDLTPVQMQAIPILHQKNDLIACAPTGTGKTLAFTLPLICKLEKKMKKGFRALVISPTRELAQQTYATIKFMCADGLLKVCLLKKSILAGMKSTQSSKFDVLVSTPLRLKRAVEEGIINLSNVKLLVFDEADKLMEKGFLEQMDGILTACTHKKLQKALFSATIDSGVEQLARTFMKDPIRIVIGQKNAPTSSVDQKLIYVSNEDGKIMAFRQLVRGGVDVPMLVFVESTDKANLLYSSLLQEGIHVDMISSERNPSHREDIVRKFREKKIWVLIATDLLARGMDFKEIKTVINYDFPKNLATYIHRIGRTGRGMQRGKAITFFTNENKLQLRSIAFAIKGSGGSVPEWMLQLPKSK